MITEPIGGAAQPRDLPPGIRVRSGTVDDEFASFEVMRRSFGSDVGWSAHAAIRHHLRESPGAAFFVAEEQPRFGAARVVGYARSLVRDAHWMLTEFFLIPSWSGRGIGTALLRACLNSGRAARSRFILASEDRSADALYIRHALLLPRMPMMLFTGPLASLANQWRPDRVALSDADAHAGAPLVAEPMVPEPHVLDALDVLDRGTLGYARRPEHLFWMQDSGGPHGASRLFRDVTLPGSPIVAYGYIGPNASGPILTIGAGMQPDIVAALCRRAQDGVRPHAGGQQAPINETHWAVAGTNEVMLRWLLGAGWRIGFQYLYMSSHDAPHFERYVCCTPLYVM
ncbi:MAG: GNAT family N-acetyltransferase [Armatimonadetes bacterium]|nr:GNAT family N-acetyltransferase [Armatimonadota bacterium]MDE2207547.1 GNAT family N-acetyltransferase [Armatimonadota bacterium]